MSKRWLTLSVVFSVFLGASPGFLPGPSVAQEKDIKYMTREEIDQFWKDWNKKRERAYRLAKAAARAGDGPVHDREKSIVISGNQITVAIYNYASISRPGLLTNDLLWPKGDRQLGYAYEFGPLAAAEVVDTSGNVVHIVEDGFISASDGDYEFGTANKWGWLPRVGFSDPESDVMATFSARNTDKDNDGKPDTWPESWFNQTLQRYVWPAFLGDDATTPDEEVYFAVDDYADREFAYFPFPDDSSKRGLGLMMECRYFQFNNPLAEDIIFLVYTVTNTSPKDLDRVYFGMFGDPHVGGLGDHSDDDADFIGPFDEAFPFGARNMLYAFDPIPIAFGKKTGYFGYKFLESPAIDDDGIDNDGDGLIDESGFNDAGAFIIGPVGIYGDPKPHWEGDEDGDWNPQIDDVGADGIPGTEDFGEGNGMPDQGEPNFGFLDIAELDQLGLTSFNALPFGGNNRPKNDELMWEKMSGTLDETEIEEGDNVFIYGSGPFQLKAGEVQRFSIALLMGEDLPDLIQNALTAQQVFESDYRFAKPPSKPKLTAVPGDKKVTLYWDAESEQSFDPFIARGHPDSTVLGFDFEGYKVYRSTDFSFDDTKVITDAAGNPFLSRPMTNERGVPAQFDLDNDYSGLSAVEYKGRGVRFDLGRNTGLTHVYVDSNNVVNGKTYFYAVTAYDHGDSSLAIAPSETQRDIKRDPVSGEFTFDINTAMVIPGPPASGFQEPAIEGDMNSSAADHVSGLATGDVIPHIIDPLAVQEGKAYEIAFTVENDTTRYSVLDETPVHTSFVARDTFFVSLGFPFLNAKDLQVQDAAGNTIDPSDYIVDALEGQIRGANPGDLRNGETYTAVFTHFPVWRSTFVKNEDGNPVFDGILLKVKDDTTALDLDNSGWKVLESSSNLIATVGRATIGNKKVNVPIDFEFQFVDYDTNAAGQLTNPAGVAFSTNVEAPFRVIRTDTGEEVEFVIQERDKSTRNGRWDWNEIINLLNPDDPRKRETTYSLSLAPPLDTTLVDTTMEIISGGDTTIVDTTLQVFTHREPIYPKNGDVFVIASRKPFNSADRYRFTTRAATFSQAKARDALADVYVVPNPYVAFSEGELASPRIGRRDERKIEFRNLPTQCTVRIYTITGELVKTLEKNDTRDFVAWNLLSFEAQRIAYGIYIYHVEAPGIGEKVGRFAIIK